jgi:type VI secretion system (T6SS) effector Hcp
VGIGKWIGRPARAVALLAAGAVGAGAAIAVASVPDSNGVIHACVEETGTVPITGPNVRIIDPNAKQTCTSTPGAAGTEQAISWNTTGPQGPAGAPGAAGPPGPEGQTLTINGETFTISGINRTGTIENTTPPPLLGNPGGHAVGALTLGSGQRALAFNVLAWGVGQQGTAQGSGAGARRKHVSDLQITKVVDKTSAKLFAACASGQHYKRATLVLRKAGGTYLTIRLTDVLVSSYEQSNGSASKPTESISLNFTKIQYKSQ